MIDVYIIAEATLHYPRGGYPVLPDWVSFSLQWFWDMVDIEKLWSYWHYGCYLLPVGRQQLCLNPHSNIHFIAAIGGLKMDKSRPTCVSLKPCPGSEVSAAKIWCFELQRFSLKE